MKIGIIRTGTSNEASVIFALERLGVETKVVTSPSEMLNLERFVLPGVGSASRAMESLRKAKLIDSIRNLDKPLLGICLGMQILFEYSEEDNCECLGIFPGKIEKIPTQDNLRVPHMGWNNIFFQSSMSPILKGLDDGDYLYFVHSYWHTPDENTIATCHYGSDFTSIVGRENFFGCQFHPERSSSTGNKLLQNFLEV